MNARPIMTEPFDIELSPGRRVRDLKSKEECQQATFHLEVEMANIQTQIANSETNPSAVAPGWRTRAQSALRWKKRARTAVLDFSRRFEPQKPPLRVRYDAVLNALRDDLGNDRFEAFMLKVRERVPSAFEGASDE
jgi:hypothetical protein